MSSSLQKKSLHPRNIHNDGYDFHKLVKKYPAFGRFLIVNDFGAQTVDFANPEVVLELNRALLFAYYDIKYWELAKNSLCPAIPGRADYIHHIADLLASDVTPEVAKERKIKVLDIGTGASVIYPILGHRVYGWDFVGSDIDTTAIHYAEMNIGNNPHLKKHIQVRLQEDPKKTFQGIVNKGEKYDVVICNPPFYKSRADNWKSATKKSQNLSKIKERLTVQNFGGHPNELWCEGGERAFVRNMIYESMNFKTQLGWVSSLISDKENIKPLVAVLEYNKAAAVKIIPMTQGNKVSRILAWKW